MMNEQETTLGLFDKIDYGFARDLRKSIGFVAKIVSDISTLEGILSSSCHHHEVAEFVNLLNRGLSENSLYFKEAAAITGYLHKRFSRHTVNRNYNPTYWASDKKTAFLPEKTRRTVEGLPDRIYRVGTFFELAERIEELRDFDVGSFEQVWETAFNHLAYVQGLPDRTHLILITLISIHGGLIKKYEEDLKKRFFSADDSAQKEIQDDYNQLTDLQEAIRQNKIYVTDVIGYFRYLEETVTQSAHQNL